MIRRVLVANRGEIALRIIRACREMGIECAAIFSDADRLAPHVAAADFAVPVGGVAAAESYLSIEKVTAAAKTVGADAVHPGYGFLSESDGLAAACEAQHLAFIGPPSRVIARMGSKIEARRLMQEAGVPVVPGETPANQSDEGIRAVLEHVGVPALVKASAGGGGKGMREIATLDSAVEEIRAARREAFSAFGDGTLYVERLVRSPRHIEVQVFADSYGHVVHLFERECSVQRRHQKVIEESPSPALTAGLRSRITETAVRAARACEYRNAGTIEFLVEGAGAGNDDAAFYFLEMNTRLQVEHPVTEGITGLDLVRAQLLVAGGEPLPWTQAEIGARGHAIEARVYAEDPGRGFLPQAGPLLLYREPRLPGVRVDAGVVEGGDVSVHYDPLLAKVIARAETRELARRRLVAALRAYPILGVTTNVPFLLRILEHPEFVAGRIDTGFLDREAASLCGPAEEMPAFLEEAVREAASSFRPQASGARSLEPGPQDPWSRLTAWRP